MTEEHTLTDEQEQAIDIVKNSNISILTGAPGVGKTYIAKMIIDEHIKRGFRTLLCAPSGKAARRLAESTEREATTIHKMLDSRMMGEGHFEFMYNVNKQLPADFIVVDESSMIDLPLMASLMEAIDTDSTKLLFIGDDHQLPPVGMGCVFKDMIKSGTIPVAVLTIIQRAKGDIVKSCHDIKNGEYYIPRKKINLEAGHNLIHVDCETPTSIVKTIERIVVDFMPKRGYDPIWEVQVLSPTNSRTLMSCDNFNGILQSRLNKNKPGPTGFAIGDKVINIKNTPTAFGYLMNGDMGTIEDIEGKDMWVNFFGFENPLQLPLIGNNLLHAYCCTAHRYQGSEVPVVVIPVHSSFNFFVTRPWIYTAISRAQKICITVGQFKSVESAIRHEDASKRVTRLQQKLASQES